MFSSYSAKTKRDRRTDRRGALQYLPSRAFGTAGDKNILFSYLGGGGGGPMSNPGEHKFQGSKTSSQSRPMYNKGNKATRSPEISRQQVQKLKHNFCSIYIGYRFLLSLSTIWGNHLPVNFMLKFPTCISTIWRNHLPFNQEVKGHFSIFPISC